MGELGSLLTRAREARGLTIEDAERDTRISRRYLFALEAEQFDVIPAPVYARLSAFLLPVPWSRPQGGARALSPRRGALALPRRRYRATAGQAGGSTPAAGDRRRRPPHVAASLPAGTGAAAPAAPGHRSRCSARPRPGAGQPLPLNRPLMPLGSPPLASTSASPLPRAGSRPTPPPRRGR